MVTTRSRSRAIAAQNNNSSRTTRSTTARAIVSVIAQGSRSTTRRSNRTVRNRRSVEFGRVSERLLKTRQLMKSEKKLVRSCKQIHLLNDKIQGITIRYHKARADGFKTFRYNLRIRLAAFEGVRNMFYEYARDRAEEVAELRKELYDQNVLIVARTDSYESDEEFDISDDDVEDY